MKQLTKIFTFLLLAVFLTSGSISAQNWKKLANTAKNKAIQNQQKKESNSTTLRSDVNENPNDTGSQTKDKTATQSQTNDNVNTNSQGTPEDGTVTPEGVVVQGIVYNEDSIAAWDAFFQPYRYKIGDFRNLAEITWSPDWIADIKQFNFPEIQKMVVKAGQEYPLVYSIYLSNIGETSDKPWIMSRENYQNIVLGVQVVNPQIKVIDVANNLNIDRDYIYNAQDFFRNYFEVIASIRFQENKVLSNLRNEMMKVDQRPTLDGMLYLKDYFNLVNMFYPDDDEQVNEIEEEINDMYDNFMANLQADGTISGKFHKDHIQEVVFFNSKPTIGKENEADITTTMIPGKPIYIAGYFSQKTDKMPVIRLIEAKGNSLSDPALFNRGGYLEIMLPYEPLVSEFKGKSYLTLNFFPDPNTVNFDSHYAYLLTLNFLKWVKFLPSGNNEYYVQFATEAWGGKELARGKITIKMSKEIKDQIKVYYDQIYDKYLHSLYYPAMAGCQDAKSKVANLSDLNKFGKVLKLTLSKAGNIMKPWPNDDQVDWNTAFGYCAVEKDDGTCVVLPLEFRKKPGATMWQWWSISSFDGEPIPYVKQADINYQAVKNINGYKILKENVYKCKKWY